MNAGAATHLEQHIELLQLVNTEGSLCYNSSHLKHDMNDIK